MRRTFRRRNRGLWFPVQQNNPSTTVTTAATGGAVSSQFIPILASSLDAPPTTATLIAGAGSAMGLLAVTLGGSYLTKRIVGEVFAFSSEAAAGAQTRFAFAGLLVDRVDEGGLLQNATAWNPFDEGSAQKRWLWRRTWHLEGSGAFGAPALMSANSQYGGIRQGPVLDCKMKARVTYEERLFLCVSVQNGPANSATNTIFRHHLRMFACPIQKDNR